MPRVIVRQNPDPRGSNRADGTPQVKPEYCPEHGAYLPRRAWLDLRRRALSGLETPGRAMAMLEAAARIRRTCRQCNAVCITGPEWARRVRFATEQGRRDDQ